MTPDGASEVAVRAFDRISVGARNAAMLLMTDETMRQCILDGSAYSPSWRVLAEGEMVYRADEEGGHEGALCEAFDETLEECIREWSGRNEETMGWDDGCLFVFGTEFDFDQM